MYLDESQSHDREWAVEIVYYSASLQRTPILAWNSMPTKRVAMVMSGTRSSALFSQMQRVIVWYISSVLDRLIKN
jgi:hypothetical protein